jgi:hypothetical protein
MSILIGMAAKLIFDEWLKNNEATECKGIFFDKGLFIAFDNSTGECWQEEFKDINNAFSWIKAV